MAPPSIVAPSSPTVSSTWVRRITLEDATAIKYVSLVTADKGRSATDLLRHPELPAQVLALPYISLPTGFGFVVVEQSSATRAEHVVGYLVGTSDTASYERVAEETWWPPLRLMYPLDAPGTPLDEHYTSLMHKSDPSPADILTFSPAHVHVDILPEYRPQGWVRRLMDLAVQHLQDAGLDGLWVSSNSLDAQKFYRKLGFIHIRDKWMGLKFSNFAAPLWPSRISISSLDQTPALSHWCSDCSDRCACTL